MRRCATVGMGMVTGPQPGRTARWLEAEATLRAIEDADLKPSQIYGAIQLRRTGGEGKSVSNRRLSPGVGPSRQLLLHRRTRRLPGRAWGGGGDVLFGPWDR